jgi:hypothetical protein
MFCARPFWRPMARFPLKQSWLQTKKPRGKPRGFCSNLASHHLIRKSEDHPRIKSEDRLFWDDAHEEDFPFLADLAATYSSKP